MTQKNEKKMQTVAQSMSSQRSIETTKISLSYDCMYVVVVFIFQYGNIHLHTSGSIFINKNIFEEKTI